MSDNKYKINIDRPELSKEEIEGHKNFEELFLLAGLQRKPIFQRPLFWAGTGILALCLSAFFMYQAGFFHPKTEKTIHLISGNKGIDDNYFKVPQFCINPPFNKMDIPYEYFKVNAKKGGTFHSLSGTKLIIPSLVFSDNNGNTINGKIIIRYREMHDLADCFISGIPMTYDSAGKTYDFQTAGMFDIQAFQDNKPVNMVTGKTIDIEMVSHEKGHNFNIYKLDTGKRKWTYLRRDMVRIEPKYSGKEDNLLIDNKNVGVNEVVLRHIQPWANYIGGDGIYNDTIEPEIYPMDIVVPPKPLLPIEASLLTSTHTLKINPKEFPELKFYRGVVFKRDNAKTDCGASITWLKWENTKLMKDTKNNLYYIELSKKERANYSDTLDYLQKDCRIYVSPVFKGADYKRALAIYNSKMEQYQQALKLKGDEDLTVDQRKAKYKRLADSLKKDWAIKQKERTAQQKIYEEQAQKQYEESLKTMNSDEKKKAQKIHKVDSIQRDFSYSTLTYGEVRRVIQIRSFGIYNSDCPHHFRNPVSMKVNFKDDKGNMLVFPQTYLVDKSRRFLHTFYNLHRDESLQFEPGDRNILFGILPGNKIAVFPEKNFVYLKEKDHGMADLKMECPAQTFSTVEEVRDYLFNK